MYGRWGLPVGTWGLWARRHRLEFQTEGSEQRRRGMVEDVDMNVDRWKVEDMGKLGVYRGLCRYLLPHDVWKIDSTARLY